MSKKDAVPSKQVGKPNATGPMPGVKNVPGSIPETKQVTGHSVASAAAKNRGQTARSPQGESGDTSPKTDGGGNAGNSSEALHRKIFGK